MGTNVKHSNWVKKTGILFLTFILVLLVGLHLAPKTLATGFQAQYPFDVTIVFGEGQSDVFKPTLGSFNHGQRLSIGIDSLNGQTTVGDKDFAFYVVDGKIEDSKDYEFRVTSNTKITAVFTDGTELAAVFVDTNGEFLSIDYVDVSTAPVAPNVTELSKPGFTPVVFGQLDPIAEHTVYVVEYELTNPGAIVTINGVEYPYNSVVTLVADGPFTHWVEDGVIVSYNPTYKFSALRDRTITQATGGTAQTLVTLSNDLGVRSAEGKSTYLGQYELVLAEGETFIEAGIIASEIYVNNLTLDTPDVQIIVSNAIQPTTNEFLRTVDTDAFEVVRGYVKTSAGTVYSANQTPNVNTGLMIYEVYGGGGNSGAVYKNDFVVLFNGTSVDIDLSDYSLQYASASGSFTNINVLSGTISAGKFFIIQLSGGANGVDLPNVDGTGTLNLSGSSGKIALALGNTQISGVNGSNVVDFVGFGSANDFEGGAPVSTLSNSTSAKRSDFIDSNDNSDDFNVVTPDLTYTLDGEFYTVSFNTDGGSEISEVQVYENNKVTRPSDPTKTGYVFVNWYTSSDFTTEFNFDTLINVETTLYAKWLIERTVTFVNGETTLLTSIVGNGRNVNRPTAPLIEGYSFDDWYVDAEFTILFDFDDEITENTIIYGKYDENDSEPIFASELFISMYVEGAPGNRKAIQIFNGTGQTVNLSTYAIRLGVNGANWSTTISLSGTIAHGDVFVVRNGADGGWTADLSSTSLNFNGDDAIGLFKGETLIDIFGVINQDPGSGWSLSGPGNGSDTVDKVVARNSDVISPKTTWDRNEWYVALAIPNATTDAQVGTLLESFTWSPQ